MFYFCPLTHTEVLFKYIFFVRFCIKTTDRALWYFFVGTLLYGLTAPKQEIYKIIHQNMQTCAC